ncbi:MAG TPA: VTT domain-containing protein [Kofleriaceae bacterium]
MQITRRRIALAVLVLGFVAGTTWALVTGRVSIVSIRLWLESLGAAGPPLFVGVFVLGALIGLPGMAFVIGGRLAFGPALGFLLGYGGGLLACLAPFLLARRLGRGGSNPWRPKIAIVRRAFETLESRPIRSVLVLRLVLWFNPPLSYTLALSKIPTRAYLTGCALALAPVVALAVFATGWFV